VIVIFDNTGTFHRSLYRGDGARRQPREKRLGFLFERATEEARTGRTRAGLKLSGSSTAARWHPGEGGCKFHAQTPPKVKNDRQPFESCRPFNLSGPRTGL